jgi:hypothetical protein
MLFNFWNSDDAPMDAGAWRTNIAAGRSSISNVSVSRADGTPFVRCG